MRQKSQLKAGHGCLIARFFTSPGKPGIRIRVNEQFHVKEISNFREVEDQDTLKQNDVSGVDAHVLVRLPAKNRVIRMANSR